MNMIDNAQSGLKAAQTVFTVTSDSLANENTPGYSRQKVELATRLSSLNSGVDVIAVRRITDEYKNAAMRQASTSQGEASAVNAYFFQLEQVAGNNKTGLAAGLNQFYAALNAASSDVTSTALRDQVIHEANTLAQHFNSLTQVLSAQLTSINDHRNSIITQINSLAATVADLNSKIVKVHTPNGDSVAALLDERDRHIDTLASFIHVNVIAQPDGSKTVSLPGGPPLVMGGVSAALTTQLVGSKQTVVLDFLREKVPLSSATLSGQLGGVNEYEEKIVRSMIGSITALAGELTTRVNDQLAAGFDLNGANGAALFVFDSKAPNGALLKTTALGAEELGFSAKSNEPGNNENLSKILAVKEQTAAIPSLGTVKLDDVFTQLVGRLAIESRQNKTNLQAATVVRETAEKSWKSTSGVDRDEEVSRLIAFYQMYQANMKVVAMASKLFDSLLATV